jgi:hypothetical protein
MNTLYILEIENMAIWIRRADNATPLYLQKLALTSPTSSVRSVGIVRSWTKVTEFLYMYVCVCVYIYIYIYILMIRLSFILDHSELQVQRHGTVMFNCLNSLCVDNIGLMRTANTHTVVTGNTRHTSIACALTVAIVSVTRLVLSSTLHAMRGLIH